MTPETEALVQRLFNEGARNKHDMLVALASERWAKDCSDKTIERVVKDLQSLYEASPIGLGDIPTSLVPTALAVLADVVEYTRGRVTHLTRDELFWLERISAAAPDLAGWKRYVCAREYIAARARGQGTAALDVWLSFHPWRSEGDLKRYSAGLERGLPPPPGWTLIDIALRSEVIPSEVARPTEHDTSNNSEWGPVSD